MPRLSLAPMPITFPFVLKLSTALERHVSWNYLDFCGYFFSDWALRPDSSRHQCSQDQAVCAFVAICGCGLSQQDFKSFLLLENGWGYFQATGVATWVHRASQRVLWHQGHLSPRPLGSVTLLMALTQWLCFPQQPGRAGMTFPLMPEDDKKSQGKHFIISSVLVACSVLGF